MHFFVFALCCELQIIPKPFIDASSKVLSLDIASILAESRSASQTLKIFKISCLEFNLKYI